MRGEEKRREEMDEEFDEEQTKFAATLPRARRMSFAEVAQDMLTALCAGAQERIHLPLAEQSANIVILLNFCFSYGVVMEFAKLAQKCPDVFKGRCLFISVAAKWPGQTTPAIVDVVLGRISASDASQADLKAALHDALSTNYDSYKDAKMLYGRKEEEEPWVKELRYTLL